MNDVARTEASEMEHAEARGVPVTVVSAVTEKGVVRGIGHFTRVEEIAAEVEKAVGVLVDGVQWSTAQYRIPSYFEGLAGMSGWNVPGGIYLFRWDAKTTDWRDPEHRFASTTPELLWRPRGWATGRASVPDRRTQ